MTSRLIIGGKKQRKLSLFDKKQPPIFALLKLKSERRSSLMSSQSSRLSLSTRATLSQEKLASQNPMDFNVSDLSLDNESNSSFDSCKEDGEEMMIIEDEIDELSIQNLNENNTTNRYVTKKMTI